MPSGCARILTSFISITISSRLLATAPRLACRVWPIPRSRDHTWFPHVSRTVETHYGAVDADVLAELQQEFATSELLAALDTLGMVAARERRLRASLARLHAMASHELRGAAQPSPARSRSGSWRKSSPTSSRAASQSLLTSPNWSIALVSCGRIERARPRGMSSRSGWINPVFDKRRRHDARGRKAQ